MAASRSSAERPDRWHWKCLFPKCGSKYTTIVGPGRTGYLRSKGGFMWRRVSFVLVGLSVTACAAATPSTRTNFSSAGRDVITAAEIVASRVTDAYQAVTQLRPEFLRRRAATAIPSFTPPGVVVYLDELPFGNAESLHYIPLERVRLIRYIPPAEADLRWGG